jgi:hypothetical protein
MVAYNKPELVAYLTYIWRCVQLFTGKYIYLINSTMGINHLKTKDIFIKFIGISN